MHRLWHGVLGIRLLSTYKSDLAALFPFSGCTHVANNADHSSKNYSSWSLRGWLMAKLAGIDFDEVIVAPDDADARAEILLLSPSILVPCLTYQWNAGLGHAGDRRIPERNRAKGRTFAQGSGSSRPLPLHLRRDAFRLRLAQAGAADEHQGASSPLQDLVEGARATSSASRRSGANACRPMAARSCSARSRMADAMYAPVVSRFRTYGVELDSELKAYADRIWDWPAMQEWREGGARGEGRDRGTRGRVLGDIPSFLGTYLPHLLGVSGPAPRPANGARGGRRSTTSPCPVR